MFNVMKQDDPHYRESSQRINSQDSLFLLNVFHRL